MDLQARMSTGHYPLTSASLAEAYFQSPSGPFLVVTAPPAFLEVAGGSLPFLPTHPSQAPAFWGLGPR